MLIPHALDPVEAGEDTPLPPERPTAFSLNADPDMDDPTDVEVPEPAAKPAIIAPAPKTAAAMAKAKSRHAR
jgi:hypothetical protein